MAERKYDLLLIETKPTNKVIQSQPWYKERLKTKYFKQTPGRRMSKESLIGRNWVLLRPGQDDFRDGKPRPYDGKYFVEGSKGISPSVVKTKDSISARLVNENMKKIKPTLSKSQRYFDKALPQQCKRREHIEEVEYGLTQHPLALYPHLEEGMPTELFDEIVDLIDPAMNPDEGDDGETTSGRATTDDLMRSNIAEEDETGENNHVGVYDGSEKKVPRNPYKWILQRDDERNDDRRNAGAKKSPTSPSQDQHIKQVTQEFCNWVSGLGGESNNVEESTIVSLFASGYETKPALSVPIHVVELSHVPAELRETAGMLESRDSAKKSRLSSATNYTTKRGGTDVPAYEPSWAKIKYGAWYLKPSTWKVRLEHDELDDPELVAKREMSEAKQKSDDMDQQLVPLHGARAFRDFLERNNRRKPEFMSKVSVLQDVEEAKNNDNLPINKHFAGNVRSNHSRNTARARSSMTTYSTTSGLTGF